MQLMEPTEYEIHIDTIKELLLTQYELNKETCGDKWLEGKTNTDKYIDFLLAFRMEVAELVESIDWKHWANTKKDEDKLNMLIELVDIFHFGLSNVLMENRFSTYDDELEEMAETPLSIDRIIENIIDGDELLTNTKIKGYYLLDFRHNRSRFHYINKLFIYGESYEDDEVGMRGLLNYMFTITTDVFGISFETFLRIYKAKLYLNKFRQLNGYKTGDYTKYAKVLTDSSGKQSETKDYSLKNDNDKVREVQVVTGPVRKVIEIEDNVMIWELVLRNTEITEEYALEEYTKLHKDIIEKNANIPSGQTYNYYPGLVNQYCILKKYNTVGFNGIYGDIRDSILNKLQRDFRSIREKFITDGNNKFIINIKNTKKRGRKKKC